MRKALLVLIACAATATWWLLPSREVGDLGSAKAELPEDIETIVLISIDTIRADRLSCYGYEHPTTPHLDELAADSLVCKEAFSTIPLTLPAHSSMLTGLIPPSHGVHDNWDARLPDRVLTLAEILKARGYATYAVVSSVVLDSKFAMDQGFDVYEDDLVGAADARASAQRLGGETTEKALEWLTAHAEEKKFLFLHYYDPHASYSPPEPFAGRFEDPYDGEIAFTDHCIGRIVDRLEALGLFDESLIVVAGDHGEMLGEHGEDTHSFFVYQNAIRVPMFFRLPEGARAGEVAEPCSIIDIAPTLLAIAGVDVPAEMQGTNLLDLAGQDSSTGRAIYAESLTPTKYGASPLLSVVIGDWHYIQASQPELYNRARDPAETENLVVSEADRAAYMQSRLRKLLDTSLVPDLDAGVDIDGDTEKSLASLGYVGGSVAVDYSLDGPGLNPADVFGVHKNLSLATYLIYRDEVEAAIALCNEVIRTHPELPEAYLRLSECHNRLGAYEDEIDALNRCLELVPGEMKARKSLAGAYLEAGRVEDAEELLRQLMLDDPLSVPVRTTLCDILFDAGRFEEARVFLREVAPMPGVPQRMVVRLAQLEHDLGGDWRRAISRAKSLDARDPLVWSLEGDWLEQEGDREGAARAHRKAVELDPLLVSSLTSLGSLALASGQPAEAEALLQRAVAANPGYARAWFFLGVAARDGGEGDKALEYFEKAVDADGDDVASLTNLGGALIGVPARHAEAERYLLRAVELQPESFIALVNLGVLYMGQQNTERALWAYGRASEIEPRQIDPWTKLMVLHRIAGDLSAALAAAEEALSISREDPGAHMFAALCCEALGRSAEADSHVRAALASDPGQVQRIVEHEPSLGAIVARVQ